MSTTKLQIHSRDGLDGQILALDGMEEPEDLPGVADTDLDVVQGAEPSGWIERLSFNEERPNGIKGRFPPFLAKCVQDFEDCVVEESGVKVLAFVLGRLGACGLTNVELGVVGGRDELEVFYVDQI